MRTRLLVSFGVVGIAIGLVLAGAAMWWLSEQPGLATEPVVTGQLYKDIAAAQFASAAGIFAALGGVAAVVLGLAFRPRVMDR